MALVKEVGCPKCGCEIEYEDVINQDIIDYEGKAAYVDRGYGTCPKCGKTYSFDVVYVFVGYTKIVEEEGEDE